MKVEYANDKLKKLCTNEAEMKRKRGDIAAKLRLRINALRVANTVGDLQTVDPGGRWQQLSADRAGDWSGRVSGNERLIFTPGDPENPLDSVTVKVIEIVDYH